VFERRGLRQVDRDHRKHSVLAAGGRHTWKLTASAAYGSEEKGAIDAKGVAEPVSHANAALNEPEADWAELGLRVLEPGEEMALAMRLEVRPAGGARMA